MILARILFLIGSVLALFGAWRLIGPYIYESLAADPTRGALFLIVGAALAGFARQLENRNPGRNRD